MQARYFSFHKRLNTLGRMTHTVRDEMGGPGDPRHEVGNEDPNLDILVGQMTQAFPGTGPMSPYTHKDGSKPLFSPVLSIVSQVSETS